MMYDSSVLVWSNEWLTGNYGDWVQASAIWEKSSSMTPYESMNILLSKDDTV